MHTLILINLKHYAKRKKTCERLHIAWFYLYKMSRKAEFVETESISVVVYDWRWELVLTENEQQETIELYI